MSIVASPNKVAVLNDAFRQAGPMAAALGGIAGSTGKWMFTHGVTALGWPFLTAVVSAVRTFDQFGTRNDPYGERDFGAFTYDGKSLFWKIDYYDRTLEFGSPDPSDVSVTCRVLTVMLAEEY